MTNLRLPAEWEEQDAVLLAWPHRLTDWRKQLESVQNVYLDLITKLSPYVKIILCVSEQEIIRVQNKMEQILSQKDHDNLIIAQVEYNDTWARDFGPLTAESIKAHQLFDFQFTGWGNKYKSDLDNVINRTLHSKGVYGKNELKEIALILEGGSIEVDGNGTLLTTERCLLNQNRNNGFLKEDFEKTFYELFGVTNTQWLKHGFLLGDDTDAHIDTLARFAPNNVIVYVACDDREDEHYKELLEMEQELQRVSDASGKSYRLSPLPWPRAIFNEKGDRLPASYANYLISNDTVFVPTYEDKKDALALKTIAGAYPNRKVIGINCLPLIHQFGSLHCITMQLPKGTLN